jgi:alpha-galactosidase
MAALLRSPILRGWQIALVDRNHDSLNLVYKLAQRLNQEWDAQMSLSAHRHHAEALDNASFVILAIEVTPREVLWRTDYEIPLKYGIRQPYAENGGPGGFAHSARNAQMLG